MILSSCNKNNPEEDIFGIDYSKEIVLDGMIVDTRLGWLILTLDYGLLELNEEIADKWKTDGLIVKVTANIGKTYFDDEMHTLDQISYRRNFTFANLVELEEFNGLLGPEPPILQVVWSPYYSDETRTYPDGWGYFAQATVEGIRILQPNLPGVAGVNTFSNETQAAKFGMYVLHLLTVSNDFPGTNAQDFSFFKIDIP